MKSELNWKNGRCEEEAAATESGGGGRAGEGDVNVGEEGVEVREVEGEQELQEGRVRVPAEMSDFESGGGDAGAEGHHGGGAKGCMEIEERAPGRRRSCERVPPPADDGLDGLASAEQRNSKNAPGGAIAKALSEVECYTAPADSNSVKESKELLLQREFAHHHPGVARLNNGSFGSAPRRVLEDQAEWNSQWLRHPDAFCWDPLSDGLLAARKGLAELIGAPNVDEVVLLENATTGAAIVAVDCMWGFLEGRFERGDAILMFDSAYGAVKKCFQGYCIRAGAHLLEYKMPFPVTSNAEILRTFEEFLLKEKTDHPARTIRLAILDHVTSMPSIILPIRELVQLCRRYGVEQVFVDGAHAIGSLDINVHDINADYYMANVHKWLFGPLVVAFFHAKSEHLSRLHHPVVSHSYGTGLLNETYWVGTRDYSALLAVPKAIQFMEEFFGDLESYMKSNHEKVLEMGEMLARAWGTCLGAPPEMFASLAMVGLPPGMNIHSQDDALKMRSRLRDEFHVEVPLHYVGDSVSCIDSSKHQDCRASKVVAYARISHQVYNKLEDYHAFRDAVNMILTDQKKTVSENHFTC